MWRAQRPREKRKRIGERERKKKEKKKENEYKKKKKKKKKVESSSSATHQPTLSRKKKRKRKNKIPGPHQTIVYICDHQSSSFRWFVRVFLFEVVGERNRALLPNERKTAQGHSEQPSSLALHAGIKKNIPTRTRSLPRPDVAHKNKIK
jgi:hypothetical protein